MRPLLHIRRGAITLSLLLGINSGLALGSEQYRMEKDGRVLRLDISSDFSSGRQRELRSWIVELADSLAQVYGRWPQREWALSIVPTDTGGSDPIPWGRVHRDAVTRVEFFILPSATPQQLATAWTAYHEMAHLLIPYRGWGEAWFSEGLASYYQNLLQARAGVLTEQQMWQKLHEGFLRGLADTGQTQQSLQQVSRDFRQQRRYMRVYWSGAWYFLAADVRLRQQTGGSLSLDQALGKLNECCSNDAMSVAEMVTTLDEVNGVTLFQPLYRELRKSTAVPDHLAIFSSLGINIHDDQVELQQQASGATLRRSIYSGKPL